MRRKHYGKYIFRWIMTLLVLAGLVFAFVGGRRLLHIYLTSTGRQAADVPSKKSEAKRS